MPDLSCYNHKYSHEDLVMMALGFYRDNKPELFRKDILKRSFYIKTKNHIHAHNGIKKFQKHYKNYYYSIKGPWYNKTFNKWRSKFNS